jgi:uncharacterized protein (TIGR02246 family)
MFRLSPAFVLVLITVAHPALAQSSSDAAIRQAVQKYVVAFNAHDANAAAALYTPDGTHTYALGFTHRGRGEIARGLKEQFAGPMRGATLSIRTLHVRLLAPAIAVEEESFTLEGVTSSDNRPLPPLRGVCLAVHQHLEEGWRAAAVQCLLPPPPPPGT